MRPRPWKPPRVEVEWIDAVNYNHLHGTQPDIIARAKLLIRRTSGYLIHEAGEDVKSPALRRVILAHDYDAPSEPGEEPMIGNVTVIPAGWVIRVRQKSGRKKLQKSDTSPAGVPENV